MNYLTLEDIVSRIPPAVLLDLADDDGDGRPDTEVLAEAGESAESEMDTCLGVRFQVPIDLQQFPDLRNLLRGLALDIAEWRLRARRPPVLEASVRLHTLALATLKRLASGEKQWPGAGPPTGVPDRPRVRVFGADSRLDGLEEII